LRWITSWQTLLLTHPHPIDRSSVPQNKSFIYFTPIALHHTKIMSAEEFYEGAVGIDLGTTYSSVQLDLDAPFTVC
jgi:hypothetical protein